ncbi:pyridoxine 5'-phosphate oxidase C-terminal domain-containing protein [Streptomyces virginiae]|uniref:pyridoxine 5'-phosphate oxidase C-terminal domain-containing protein n=1 Tax=Streptomyces virginiae TaxID=1961 RepID=UPI003245314F
MTSGACKPRRPSDGRGRSRQRRPRPAAGHRGVRARAESLPARRSQVEFWQAARGRVHTRLRHERAGDGWERFRLRS